MKKTSVLCTVQWSLGNKGVRQITPNWQHLSGSLSRSGFTRMLSPLGKFSTRVQKSLSGPESSPTRFVTSCASLRQSKHAEKGGSTLRNLFWLKLMLLHNACIPCYSSGMSEECRLLCWLALPYRRMAFHAKKNSKGPWKKLGVSWGPTEGPARCVHNRKFLKFPCLPTTDRT